MAEVEPGRPRPGGLMRRGAWALLLVPLIVVALPGVAAAGLPPPPPPPNLPQYPPRECVVEQTLRATPDTIDDAKLPTTVTAVGAKFPSAATFDADEFTPPLTFGVTILLQGEQVATAQGADFSVPVTIPRGVPDTVTITAVSDDFPVCRASTVVRLRGIDRPDLPVTGSDTSGTLWLGIMTLALGAVLVVGARRRSHAGPPERRRAALAGAAAMPLAPRPVDAVLAAFAPRRSGPAPRAVLDRFTVDEQLTLLAPDAAPAAPTGPPDPPDDRMDRAMQQLHTFFANLARDDGG